MKKHLHIANLLRWSAFIVVFSRGLLYIVFGSPYRSLLWNEQLFSPFVKFVGLSWTSYANNSDSWISILETLIGFFLCLSSILFLTIKDSSSKKENWAIITAGGCMLFHAYLHFLGHNHEFPIIPEYMIQALLPWLFLSYLPYMPGKNQTEWSSTPSKTYQWTKLAISMCFIGHGLYALGVPYQPAGFVRLLVNITGLEYEAASMLVTCVGLFDLALGITVFIKPLENLSLAHMAYWGFVTAFARITAYVIIPGRLSNLNPWLFETTVRLAHGSLPLFLLFLLRSNISKSEYFSFSSLGFSLKKWQTCAGISFICLVLLSTIRVNQPTDHDVSKLKTKRNIKLTKTIKREKSLIALNEHDFQMANTGELFADNLFDFPFPNRLEMEVDLNTPKTVLKNFYEFAENRSIIEQSLKEHLVEVFRQKQSKSQRYTDDEILRFTEKVYLNYDSGDTLSAHVHLPWLNERVLKLEIDSSGSLNN